MKWLIILAGLLYATEARVGLWQQGSNADDAKQQLISLIQNMKARKEKQCEDQNNLYIQALAVGRDAKGSAEGVMRQCQQDISDANDVMDTNANLVSREQNHNARRAVDKKHFLNDVGAADAVRNMENEDFTSLYAEYMAAKDGAMRALKLLSEHFSGAGGDRSFLQTAFLQLRMVPEDVKTEVVSLAQDNNYGKVSPRTNGVIEMLKDLINKFNTESFNLKQKEEKRSRAYQSFRAQTNERINQLTSEIAEGKRKIGDWQKESAANKAEKNERTNEHNTNNDIKTQKEQEIASILSDQKDLNDDCAGDISLYNQLLTFLNKGQFMLAQLKAKAGFTHGFLQFNAEAGSAMQVSRAFRMLKADADRTKSPVLAALIAQAQGGPFTKVIDMVGKLIEKLKDDNAREASEQMECDKSLYENEVERKKATKTLIKTVSKVDADTSNRNRLQRATEARNKEQKEMKHDHEEDAAIRREMSKRHKEVTDMCKNFIDQLKGLAGAVEQHQEAQGGEEGGKAGQILDFLASLETDFQNLHDKTASKEAAQADAWANQVEEWEAYQKQSVAENRQRELEIQTANQDIADGREDAAKNGNDLESSIGVYQSLHQKCLARDPVKEFEARMKGRQEEIESLQNALEVLDPKN